MAGSRTTFEKLQRDRAKKAKAEAKRAKRMGLTSPNGPQPSETPEEEPPDAEFGVNLDKELSAEELLTMVEVLQRQFDNEEIDFDEYEERKIELMTRLPID